MTCAEKTAWLQSVKTAASAVASAGTAMAALKSAASAAELERTIRMREQLAVEIGRLVAAMDSAEEKKKAYLEWLRKDAARIVEGREDAERRSAIDSIASMRGHSEVTADSEVVLAVARMREAAAAKDMKAFRKAYDDAVAAADKAWKPQTQQEKDTAAAMAAICVKHTCGKTDAVNDVNPNFGKNEYPGQWDHNCQRCVPAAALVRMGWRVEAKPHLKGYDKWAGEWINVFVGMRNSGKRWNTRTELENLMKAWGDGAIAEIYVMWDVGSAHVFMAEQIGGKTVFTCPQTHSQEYDPFPRVKTGSGWAYRIDDKAPNPALVKQYFSSAKKRRSPRKY